MINPHYEGYCSLCDREITGLSMNHSVYHLNVCLLEGIEDMKCRFLRPRIVQFPTSTSKPKRKSIVPVSPKPCPFSQVLKKILSDFAPCTDAKGATQNKRK